MYRTGDDQESQVTVSIPPQRIFVFKEKSKAGGRPYLYAVPERDIVTIRSQWGSQNCWLVVNGIEVEGSFDQLVGMLGERVDIT